MLIILYINVINIYIIYIDKCNILYQCNIIDYLDRLNWDIYIKLELNTSYKVWA